MRFEPEKIFKTSFDQFYARLGSISAVYNLSVMAVVWKVIDYDPRYSDYTVLQQSIINTLPYLGIICGVPLGAMADKMGRRCAAISINVILASGIIVSAFFYSPNFTVNLIFMGLGRTLAGIGGGASHGLSATVASEGKDLDHRSASRKVALVELICNIGAILPYAVTLIYWNASREAAVFTWRATLLSGALFPITLAFLGIQRFRDSEKWVKVKRKPFRESFNNRENALKLFPTVVNYFFGNFAYYGLSMYSPNIISAVTGSDPDINVMCYQNIVVVLCTLPAAWSGYLMIKRWSTRTSNIIGFGIVIATALVLVIAFPLTVGKERFKWLNLVLYATFVFSVSVPTTGIYTMPAVIYTSEVRGTITVLHQACGKLGGAAGSFLIPMISTKFGVVATMITMLVAGICAFLLSYCFNFKPVEELERMEKSYAHEHDMEGKLPKEFDQIDEGCYDDLVEATEKSKGCYTRLAVQEPESVREWIQEPID